MGKEYTEFAEIKNRHQVTVPKKIRKKLGWDVGDELQWVVDENDKSAKVYRVKKEVNIERY